MTAIILSLLPLSAQAENVQIPDAWKSCEADADCVYVRNHMNCNITAVNKSYEQKASDILAQDKSDHRALGLDQKEVRCLNQPEAQCLNKTCQFVVHPE